MPSSYYKPCKELDRCLELNKYWDTDKKKWFEGYYKIANETHYPLSECQLGYCYLEGIGTERIYLKQLNGLHFLQNMEIEMLNITLDVFTKMALD